MRTIIDIPQNILDEIDALAKQEKISRAEAVRRAMAEYLEKRPRSRPDAAFGIWKPRKIDPLAYEDALRGEWNR
ncbi:MAG: ribbon-helix-helix protein, CopG family [Gemmatimonadaceae bacterium]|nr:ribbon-helix-helix protein, CopG family [Gemmatimonadaceae bacterium]